MKVDSALIPGGCTKYIQAPDVYWNKPFKGFITESYDEWLANGAHQFTEAGNMKPAARRLVVTWILDAWQKISKNQIIASFKGCALNIKTDGSEDDLIHCFKEDQPCSTGKEILKDQTRLLRDDSLHENPFSPTDSDVEDANASFNLLDENSDEDDFVSVE